MDIINIKLIRAKTLDIKVAYCGLNYNYWRKIFPIMNQMDNFGMFGKPRHLIVHGDRDTTVDVNYRRYLTLLFNGDKKEKIYAGLRALREYDALACWCAPLKCHCNVIWDFIQLVETLDNIDNEGV